MGRMSLLSSLFRSSKNLSVEVKKGEERRSSETYREFQEEEEPCTSYDQKRRPVMWRDPNNWNLPFTFEKEDKLQKYRGHLDHKILKEYLVEYKSQPRAFKETLVFP